MAFKVLVEHLSNPFMVTTSTSWDFHFIISAFKLENCSLKKIANTSRPCFKNKV